MQVHPDQVVFMCGQLYVELQLTRAQLAAAQKKIEALKSHIEGKPDLEVVK